MWSGPHTQDTTHTFKVINVDDLGQERNPGRIEITESELVWFQRNKEPIRWPLNSLRRYGFDAELFSFECGRRCPTGPGIYAFKCRQAEALFNLLQESVQRQRTGQEDVTTISTPTVTTTTVPSAQTHTEGHSSSNGTASSIRASHRESGAVGSPLYINEQVNAHEYINTNNIPDGTSRHNPAVGSNAVTIIVPPGTDNEHVIQYAELDLPTVGDNGIVTESTGNHVPNGSGPSSGDVHLHTSSQQAMYVNVPASEIKAKTSSLGAVKSPGPRNGLTRQYSKGEDPQSGYSNLPNSGGPHMNYAQLDLISSSDSVANGSTVTPVSLSTPESPSRKTEAYAMIDIERTQALNSKLSKVEDDCMRKTRHNSNIDELL